MSDLFLEPPSKPRRGCLFTGLCALLLVALAVWFFFFRGDKPFLSGEDAAADPQAASPETPITTDGAVATPTEEGTPAAGFNPATDRGAALLIEARQLKDQDNLLGAQKKAFEALSESKNPEAINGAEAILSELNIRILLNPIPSPEKTEYFVKSGDVLSKIAQRLGTTVDLIARSNQIRNHIIRPRQRLLIPKGTFSIVVDKSDNDLLVTFNDRFFKRYRVGTGQHNKTPVGSFKINDKISEPTWWRPDGKAIPYGDPENLLGTRWLSLDIRSYGIHGTWEPKSIGSQSSAGCIRMLNEDVEELFTYVPIGTEVKIQD